MYETTHQTPFPTSHPESPEYVEHEGTYYRLGHVVVGEERVRHPVLRLYDVGEDSDLDETPAHVGSHELPRVDVRAVKRASLAARARGNMGGVPWRIVERGGSVYRDPDAVESSELLADDGPNHVGHLGRVYRVETAVERFDETVYRADVDAVADSEATFREVVDARYLDARLSEKELSAAQRDILTEAEAGDYRAKHPYPEPLRELLKAMGRRAYLDGNISKDSVDPEEFGHGLVKIDESYLRFDIALYTPTE